MHRKNSERIEIYAQLDKMTK